MLPFETLRAYDRLRMVLTIFLCFIQLSYANRQLFSRSTEEWRSCIDQFVSQRWCKPNYDHAYGNWVSSSEEPAELSKYEACSNANGKVNNADYLLCPSDPDAWGSQIKWTNNTAVKYHFTSKEINSNGLCWYELRHITNKYSNFSLSSDFHSETAEVKLFIKSQSGILTEIVSESGNDSFLLSYKQSAMILVIPQGNNSSKVSLTITQNELLQLSLAEQYSFLYFILWGLTILSIVTFGALFIFLYSCQRSKKANMAEKPEKIEEIAMTFGSITKPTIVHEHSQLSSCDTALELKTHRAYN